ncbi:hypothetical protein SSCS72_02930 [Mammaliicoccus sciuri]|uniref:HD domain-containing protein n=1 Tax=Mammaliicoccus sciuri TaxID=1296 RepID=UPI001EF517A4|nr:HD domain-containing protein [Mammaliicoccus sciuri]CAG7915109.1 hypothetical protein SSCS72_02930 [Mammaliicoccus sciuri]
MKKIRQSGANFLVNKKYSQVTRYDHSIGVMLLIKKVGGSIDEQIAGLLHDVSHTAFSHVSDLLFKVEKESSFHEQIYIDFIKKTDIPRILDEHGYNYKDILFDLTKWNLLEKPFPLLSIDRIDYTLRDMVVYENLSLKEVNNFLEKLIVFKNKLCLEDIKSGEWFLNLYFKEVVTFFMNPKNVYSHIIFKNILEYALEKGIINKVDFMKTDEYILGKLNQCDSSYIKGLFEKLEQNQVIKSNKHDYNYFLEFKVRQINPYILIENKLIELSIVSNKTKLMIEDMVSYQKTGVYIKEITSKDK